MPKGEELFKELERIVVDPVASFAKEIKFDKKDKFDFFAVALYCSVVEKAWAVLALVDRQLGAHALPILRSQLDTLADLTNLIANSKYLDHLELRQLKSRKNQFIAAKSGNPYLAQIANAFDLEEQLSIVGTDIKTLELRGAKILEPATKMKMAGMEAEHQALYPHLSDATHSGLNAMISRHSQIEGEDFIVTAFPNEKKDECLPTMQTALDALLRASSLIHSHFKTGRNEFFDEEITRQESKF